MGQLVRYMYGIMIGIMLGHMMDATQKLSRFQYHLYHMFVTVVLSVFLNVPIKKEYIHLSFFYSITLFTLANDELSPPL